MVAPLECAGRCLALKRQCNDCAGKAARNEVVRSVADWIETGDASKFSARGELKHEQRFRLAAELKIHFLVYGEDRYGFIWFDPGGFE